MSEFYDPIELARLREKVKQMSRTVGLASDDFYTARDRLFRYLRITSRTCRVKSMRSAYTTDDLLAPGNEVELKRYIAAGFNTVIVDDIVQYVSNGVGVSTPVFWPSDHIKYRILKARQYNLSIALKLHAPATTLPNGDTVAALSLQTIEERVKAWSAYDEGDLLCVYFHGDDAFLEEVPAASQRLWRSTVRAINDSLRVVTIIGEHGLAASEADRALYFDPEAFDILAVLTYPYNLGHVWGYEINRDVPNTDTQLEEYLEDYFTEINKVFGVQLRKAHVVIPVVQGFNYVGEPANKLITPRDVEVQLIEAPRKVRSLVHSQKDTYAVSLFWWGGLESPYGVGHTDHLDLLEGTRRGNYTAEIDAGGASESICQMAHDTLSTKSWPEIVTNPDAEPPSPMVYGVSPNPLVLYRGGEAKVLEITGASLPLKVPVFTDSGIVNAAPPVISANKITLTVKALDHAVPSSGVSVGGVVFDNVIHTFGANLYSRIKSKSSIVALLGEAEAVNLHASLPSIASFNATMDTTIRLSASLLSGMSLSADLGNVPFTMLWAASSQPIVLKLVNTHNDTIVKQVDLTAAHPGSQPVPGGVHENETHVFVTTNGGQSSQRAGVFKVNKATMASTFYPVIDPDGTYTYYSSMERSFDRNGKVYMGVTAVSGGSAGHCIISFDMETSQWVKVATGYRSTVDAHTGTHIYGEYNGALYVYNIAAGTLATGSGGYDVHKCDFGLFTYGYSYRNGENRPIVRKLNEPSLTVAQNKNLDDDNRTPSGSMDDYNGKLYVCNYVAANNPSRIHELDPSSSMAVLRDITNNGLSRNFIIDKNLGKMIVFGDYHKIIDLNASGPLTVESSVDNVGDITVAKVTSDKE